MKALDAEGMAMIVGIFEMFFERERIYVNVQSRRVTGEKSPSLNSF